MVWSVSLITNSPWLLVLVSFDSGSLGLIMRSLENLVLACHFYDSVGGSIAT